MTWILVVSNFGTWSLFVRCGGLVETTLHEGNQGLGNQGLVSICGDYGRLSKATL